MPVHNSWPADLEKTARELFESGQPPRTVGLAVGKTKNAIVGKSNRDAWDKSKQKRHMPSRNHKVRPLPHQFASNFDFRRKDIPQGKGSFAPIEPAQLSTPETDLLIPEAQRVGPKDDWPVGLCRWVVGDPKRPDWFFCGSQVRHDSPYCDAHHKRALHPPGPKNVSKTDLFRL